FVVPLNRIQYRAIPGFQPARELDDRLTASRHGTFADALHEKRPNLLQRIPIVRRPHRLSHHPEEIDKHLTPEEVVNLLLARSVPLHKLLELRRFVRCVVIHVKIGTASETLADNIDERARTS